MQRHLLSALVEWSGSSRRKPLVLRGARQVGKTTLLKRLAEVAYEGVAYINFEDDPEAEGLFEGRMELGRLIQRLSLHAGVTVEPGRTLVILDEIQNAPRALSSLKFLYDHGPEFHIAAAGSLLGVKTAAGTFPVGKVDFLDLYPLSFLEFLEATGHGLAAQAIVELTRLEPVTVHERMLQQLKLYMVVGGMPEAVAAHADGAELSEVRRIQRNILRGYELDFAKHAGTASAPKIQLVWEAVPKILARENSNFLYGLVREGGRARDYETALQWLLDAGLLLRSRLVSTPRLPLAAYVDSRAFKVFLIDVGLLGAMLKLPPTVLLDGHRLFSEFSGAFTENYVAQQLFSREQELFYWTSGATAEVDFLVQHQSEVLPLEVKAGNNPKGKSLKLYAERYERSVVARTTALDAQTDGKIQNYPLYMVNVFPLKS